VFFEVLKRLRKITHFNPEMPGSFSQQTFVVEPKPPFTMQEVERVSIVNKISRASEQIDRDGDGEQKILWGGRETVVKRWVILDISREDWITPGH
jgi:hypothetical protein